MKNKNGEIKTAGTLLVTYTLGDISNTVIETKEESTVFTDECFYSDVNSFDDDYFNYIDSFSSDFEESDGSEIIGTISNVEIVD